MRRIAIGEHSMAYEEAGEGTPLIQIHGAGFGHHNFGAVTPYLESHFRVINVDQLGFGESDRPQREHTFESWADDVVALMEALGLQRAHVHGSSMGGPVAVNVAVRHPERVDGLVVSCSLVRPDRYARMSYELVRSLARTYGVDSDEVARFIALCALSRDYLEGPEGEPTLAQIAEILRANNTAEVFDRAWELLIHLDLGPILGSVEAPTLVLAASEDVLITPERMAGGGGGTRELAEGIPNAEFVVIQDSSHSHLFEKPAESATAIVGFLRRLQGGADPRYTGRTATAAS